MAESFPFKLYSKLPVPLQNMCCSLAGIQMIHQRFNTTFHDFKKFLQNSEWWSLNELKTFQDEKLKDLIQYTYDTVPYYRELFDNEKLKPSDIKTQDDLYKIPILNKTIIRERMADLLSTAIPEKKRVHGKTGGTTGTALKLCYDQNAVPRHWATVWRGRNRWGIGHKDEFISFAGRNVVPLDSMDPPFWRRNIFFHQTYVSVHHLTVENMPALADYLCRRKVRCYVGYPSGIYLVARYFIENQVRLPHPPEIVFTTSESLLPFQREAISTAFSTKVTDRYAASELCVGITTCEKNNYHVDMEYGITEFLPLEHSNGSDQKRKVVCTGFWNLAMPLIRYDIGDQVSVAPEGYQCECGRQSTVVESIDGRIESYIITPDGRRLGRLDFLFKNTKNIIEAQLYQEDISLMTVKIVQSPSYSMKDEKELLNHMRKFMGKQINISFEYVPEIPREPNGKLRQIVSKLDVNIHKDQK